MQTLSKTCGKEPNKKDSQPQQQQGKRRRRRRRVQRGERGKLLNVYPVAFSKV
jgi:hypothetical protein